MSFRLHLAQWAAQGIVIFATGLLPLSITSQSILAWLAAYGMGRLITSGLTSFFGSVGLGAASTLSVPAVSSLGFSPVAGAIAHLAGVLFMLVAERRLSSRALDADPVAAELDSHTPHSSSLADQDGMELRERTGDVGSPVPPAPRTTRASGPHQRRIYLFIFAFVFGEITGGISAGYGAMAPPWKPDNDGPITRALPGSVMIFFLGLFAQVATALGFATTLLSASLQIAECKRYVLVYAAAHPSAALFSYSMTMLAQIVPSQRGAINVVVNSFTSGMFVYAALIVRALITDSRTTARSGLLARVFLMAAGALAPYVLPMMVSTFNLMRNKGLSGDTIGVLSSAIPSSTSS